MNGKIIFALLSATFMGSVSHAIAKNVYTCTVRVFAADSSVLIEQSFQADEDNGDHGGDGKDFASADGTTTVNVAVDGKWMNLDWSKNGKKIANGVFVIANATLDSRAVILYNPENSEEQMAVDCQPNDPQ